MKSLRVIFYTFLSLIAIYIVLGFFLVPYIAKKEIISNLDKLLVTKTKIEKIYFNPVTLDVKIKNFALANDKDEDLISFNDFSLSFAIFKSIEQRHLSLRNITLDGIYVNIIEEQKGVLNLANLLREDTNKEDIVDEGTKESSIDIKYLISKIVLKNAHIDFTSFLDKQKYSLNLKDINYTIYDFGTYKNSLSSNNLEFTLNENTLIKIGGGLKLEPFTAYGQINIQNLVAKEILDFDKSLFNFEINKEANLNLILNYNIEIKDNFELQLHSDLFELNNVKLKQNSNEIATLNKLDIKKFYFNLNSQEIKLEDILIKDLNAKMTMDKKGVNFANLVHTSQDSTKKDEKENTQEKPWIITLSNIHLNGNYNFIDSINNSNLNIKAINLKANKLKIINSEVNLDDAHLTTSNIVYKDKQNNLDINSNKTDVKVNNLLVKDEKIDISNIAIQKNDVEFSENSLKIKVSSKSIDLNLSKLNINKDISFSQAYLKTNKLNFQDQNSKLSIDSKNINLKANNFLFDSSNNISIKGSEVFKTDIELFDVNNSLQVNTKNSNLKVSNFIYKKDIISMGLVDFKEPQIELLNLNSNLKIEAKDIDLELQKIVSKDSFLKIERTNLNNPYLSIALPKSAQTENQKVDKKEEVAKTEDKKKFRLNLGPVDIKNMTFDFEDNSLPIPFKTKISKLNGQISNIKSKSQSTSNLEIKGVVDDYGVAKITGVVNPNNIKILTDINMKFQNIAMKNFTPYTAKFVGREIKDGKLELDLNYNITESNLKAKNSIVINKLELGKSVQSPDAISLPLDLAITLLQDSSNKIDINLPVSGNVEDPQFSIASIVWKAFVNLITKAITSPFSLLGSLFNFSEDEIKSVNFDLNESEITPIQKETLDKIAMILDKKEDIAISFSPTYNEKNEKEKSAIQRADNIKEYLVKEKSINEKQVIIDKNIKKTSSNIGLNITQLK